MKILPLWYKSTWLLLLTLHPLSNLNPTFPLTRPDQNCSELHKMEHIKAHWSLLQSHKHSPSHLSKASMRWVGFTFHSVLFSTFHIADGSQLSSHLLDLQSIDCLYVALESRSRHRVTLVKSCLVKECTSTQSLLHSHFKRLYTDWRGLGSTVVANISIGTSGVFSLILPSALCPSPPHLALFKV